MAAHHREPTVGGSRYEASRVNGFARREVKEYLVAAAAFSGVNGTVCKYVKNIEPFVTRSKFIFGELGWHHELTIVPDGLYPSGFLLQKRGK